MPTDATLINDNKSLILRWVSSIMNNSIENQNNRQIILEKIKKSATQASSTVSAIAAILLGKDLSELRKEEVDLKKFYQQAEDSSKRKKGSIDGYIRLYEVFGLYEQIIPKWMIKAHLDPAFRRLTQGTG